MIRPFTFSDLNRILEIERHAFPKSPYGWTTFISLHSLYPETFWVDVDTPSDREGGTILGYIVFSKEGHIISMAVDPSHRRRGIGKRMLKRAMETLQGRGMWAEVRKSNHGAQHFYFKLGFRVVGQVERYYGSEDALIIRWDSSSSGLSSPIDKIDTVC